MKRAGKVEPYSYVPRQKPQLNIANKDPKAPRDD
jgi:hypothetical protein